MPDYEVRLGEIAALRPGWYEPGVPVPSGESVSGMLRFMETVILPCGVPVPFLYPTLDGGVQAEWSHGDWEISATLEESGQSVQLDAVNVMSMDGVALEIPLRAVDLPDQFRRFWDLLPS